MSGKEQEQEPGREDQRQVSENEESQAPVVKKMKHECVPMGSFSQGSSSGSSSEGSSNILQLAILPSELLIFILKYLDRKSLLNLGKTSRGLRAVRKLTIEEGVRKLLWQEYKHRGSCCPGVLVGVCVCGAGTVGALPWETDNLYELKPVGEGCYFRGTVKDAQLAVSDRHVFISGVDDNRKPFSQIFERLSMEPVGSVGSLDGSTDPLQSVVAMEVAGGVLAIACSTDKQLSAGQHAVPVLLYDANLLTYTGCIQFEGKHQGGEAYRVGRLRLSPDGKTLAVVANSLESKKRQLRLYSTQKFCLIGHYNMPEKLYGSRVLNQVEFLDVAPIRLTIFIAKSSSINHAMLLLFELPPADNQLDLVPIKVKLATSQSYLGNIDYRFYPIIHAVRQDEDNRLVFAFAIQKGDYFDCHVNTFKPIIRQPGQNLRFWVKADVESTKFMEQKLYGEKAKLQWKGEHLVMSVWSFDTNTLTFYKAEEPFTGGWSRVSDCCMQPGLIRSSLSYSFDGLGLVWMGDRFGFRLNWFDDEPKSLVESFNYVKV